MVLERKAEGELEVISSFRSKREACLRIVHEWESLKLMKINFRSKLTWKSIGTQL